MGYSVYIQPSSWTPSALNTFCDLIIPAIKTTWLFCARSCDLSTLSVQRGTSMSGTFWQCSLLGILLLATQPTTFARRTPHFVSLIATVASSYAVSQFQGYRHMTCPAFYSSSCPTSRRWSHGISSCMPELWTCAACRSLTWTPTPPTSAQHSERQPGTLTLICFTADTSNNQAVL